MNYKLFLDDIRYPHMIYSDKHSTLKKIVRYVKSWCSKSGITRSLNNKSKENDEWMIARTFEEAVTICEANGCPDFISFDHDLGIGPSGYDFANWIVEQDLDNPGFISKDFKFNVHSSNPPGAENILKYLERYLLYKKEGI